MGCREGSDQAGSARVVLVLAFTLVMGAAVSVGVWNRSPDTTVATSPGSEPVASTTTVDASTTTVGAAPAEAGTAATPVWCEVDGVVTRDVPSLRPDDLPDEMQEEVRRQLRLEELFADGRDHVDADESETGPVPDGSYDRDDDPPPGPDGELHVPLVVGLGTSDDEGVRFVSVSDRVSTTILGVTSSTGRVLTYSYEHSWDCPSLVALEIDVTEHGATIIAELQTAEQYLVQLPPPWAIDGKGDDVPTWYEADGSTLIQVVDPTNAVAPIVFV